MPDKCNIAINSKMTAFEVFAILFHQRRISALDAKILIVDDSLVTTEFLKNILEHENYSITISHDGKNIVDLIEANNIDIVLLDIILPETNGYEILKLLQSTASTRDVPVVMITSLTSAMDVKKALDLGALDFIRKASEPIEVTSRIRSALRLKRKQDMLKQSAQKDSLTQLYNKQFFNITLEKLIKEKANYCKGIALLLLDGDFFKRINDRYGHTSGDMVLASIANAIIKSVKSTDIVCRFGGEEFCVICPNATLFQAFAIAERIRNNIGKIPFIFHGETVKVTVSCGISHTDCNDVKSGLKMVNEADIALYRAKSNGRNQTVLFSDDGKTQ